MRKILHLILGVKCALAVHKYSIARLPLCVQQFQKGGRKEENEHDRVPNRRFCALEPFLSIIVQPQQQSLHFNLQNHTIASVAEQFKTHHDDVMMVEAQEERTISSALKLANQIMGLPMLYLTSAKEKNITRIRVGNIKIQLRHEVNANVPSKFHSLASTTSSSCRRHPFSCPVFKSRGPPLSIENGKQKHKFINRSRFKLNNDPSCPVDGGEAGRREVIFTGPRRITIQI